MKLKKKESHEKLVGNYYWLNEGEKRSRWFNVMRCIPEEGL